MGCLVCLLVHGGTRQCLLLVWPCRGHTQPSPFGTSLHGQDMAVIPAVSEGGNAGAHVEVADA